MGAWLFVIFLFCTLNALPLALSRQGLAWRSTTTWNRPGTADRGPRPGTAPEHHGTTKKIQNPPDLLFTEGGSEGLTTPGRGCFDGL
jgi:hypothetical protein